jgi:hypothetical protein
MLGPQALAFTTPTPQVNMPAAQVLPPRPAVSDRPSNVRLWLKEMGLVRYPVPGDGNCWFYSVRKVFDLSPKSTEKQHLVANHWRRKIAKWMETVYASGRKSGRNGIGFSGRQDWLNDVLSGEGGKGVEGVRKGGYATYIRLLGAPNVRNYLEVTWDNNGGCLPIENYSNYAIISLLAVVSQESASVGSQRPLVVVSREAPSHVVNPLVYWNIYIPLPDVALRWNICRKGLPYVSWDETATALNELWSKLHPGTSDLPDLRTWPGYVEYSSMHFAALLPTGP